MLFPLAADAFLLLRHACQSCRHHHLKNNNHKQSRPLTRRGKNELPTDEEDLIDEAGGDVVDELTLFN